jgi:hypothetical protein
MSGGANEERLRALVKSWRESADVQSAIEGPGRGYCLGRAASFDSAANELEYALNRAAELNASGEAAAPPETANAADDSPLSCARCSGTGRIWSPVWYGDGPPGYCQCSTCGGTGRRDAALESQSTVTATSQSTEGNG